MAIAAIMNDVGHTLELCAKQLAQPQTSVAATVLSCALTIIDVAQTVFSACITPISFGFGALTGFAVSVALNNAIQGAPPPVKENGSIPAIYSLFIGTLPASLVQISSVARRVFCSSLVLGFRCGALAPHAYYHIQDFRKSQQSS